MDRLYFASNPLLARRIKRLWLQGRDSAYIITPCRVVANSPQDCELARKRIADDAPLFTKLETSEPSEQTDLEEML